MYGRWSDTSVSILGFLDREGKAYNPFHIFLYPSLPHWEYCISFLFLSIRHIWSKRNSPYGQVTQLEDFLWLWLTMWLIYKIRDYPSTFHPCDNGHRERVNLPSADKYSYKNLKLPDTVFFIFTIYWPPKSASSLMRTSLKKSGCLDLHSWHSHQKGH